MKERKNILWNLIIGLLVIGIGGCAAVYCARAYGEDPWYFSGRQMLWLTIGVFLFWGTACIPYQKLKLAAVPAVIISLIVLALTAVWGVKINNMNGWIPIPFTGIRFQPSEIVKPAYLLLLCMLAVKEDWSEKKRFLFCLLLTALFAGGHVLLEDVHAYNAGVQGSYICGMEGFAMENIVLRNCSFEVNECAEPCWKDREVTEEAHPFPSTFTFGNDPFPALLFVRHVKGFLLENVKFRKHPEDQRKECIYSL